MAHAWPKKNYAQISDYQNIFNQHTDTAWQKKIPHMEPQYGCSAIVAQINQLKMYL